MECCCGLNVIILRYSYSLQVLLNREFNIRHALSLQGHSALDLPALESLVVKHASEWLSRLWALKFNDVTLYA